MTLRSRLKLLGIAAADRAPAVVDLYRMSVHPRWEVANWWDYRSTRRSIGWLREIPEPPRDAPAALIVLRREDIYDIKSSLMLGAALKLEGVRPVILANHPRVPRIRRYAKAFGLGSLRFRTEFRLDRKELAELATLASTMMMRGDDFAAVRTWTYRGHPSGERVLSTLIRRTLAGEPDLESPTVRTLMAEILRQVLANYHEAEKVLDRVCPRWILADESGYAANGPLVDLALSRSLDVFETSPFLREGALMLKRMNSSVGRAAPTSVSSATLERLEGEAWTPEQDEELEREIESRYLGGSSLQRMYQGQTEAASREEICREFDLNPRLPIAVVFSHVLWDASFFYGEDLFANYQEWLKRTVLGAVDNPRVSWLVKAHPANAFRLKHGDVRGPVAEVQVVQGCVTRLPGHVRLVLPETRISSLALYRHADLGVTVRSTAGLEMACYGKPVITAGTGHYSGLGFTRDSRTSEEYLQRLGCIEKSVVPLSKEERIRARRYALALFKLRPWVARSFELRIQFPDEGWHPLDRNVVPRARSLQEARENGDLHRWAEWAVRCKSADYLEKGSL